MPIAYALKYCVKTPNQNNTTTQILYRLEPPLAVDWPKDRLITHVIVSGSEHPAFNIKETYIFEADATGEVMDWVELPGSFQGEINHAKALANMGYNKVRNTRQFTMSFLENRETLLDFNK